MKEFFKKIFKKENLSKFYRTYIWLMVLLFVVDIVTKWAVVNHFGAEAMSQEYGIRKGTGAIEIIKNFCYIGGAINDKAAFSLGPNRVILLLISIVMTGIFIGIYVKQFNKLNTVYKVAMALVISGGFGNLIDRAFYWPSTTGFNGVVDWILFYFWGHDFPMFNIADSCLVIGIFMLIIQMVIDEVKDARKKSRKMDEKDNKNIVENEGNKGE